MAILVSHQKSLCDSWTWNLPTNTENPLLLAQKGSPDGHLGFCEQGKLAKKLFGKTLQNSSSGQKKKMFYWNYFAVAWVTGRKQKYFDLPSVNEVCVTGVGAKKKKNCHKIEKYFYMGKIHLQLKNVTNCHYINLNNRFSEGDFPPRCRVCWKSETKAYHKDIIFDFLSSFFF